MFTPRLTRPGAGNKYYIRKAQGGYSNAIWGKPVDANCNVLSNCVGYAYGRFNEIGQYGSCKYLAPVNAEDFMKYKGSCKTGMAPKLGACAVWQGKGSLAGHVAIVEKIIDSNTIVTSESGYGQKNPFWTTTRKNTNGRWGANSNYPFLGFIYNPAVPDEPTPIKTIEELAHEVIEGKWGNGEERKRRLTEAGYDYAKVQARVNELVSGKMYIQLTANVWCRLKGYGFKYAKYKVIPKNTKCELITKNIGSANGYKWDKVKWNGTTVYLPNNWNKYL